MQTKRLDRSLSGDNGALADRRECEALCGLMPPHGVGNVKDGAGNSIPCRINRLGKCRRTGVSVVAHRMCGTHVQC